MKEIKMFRLGVFSDEIDDDFERALKVSKELGLKYLELRTVWGKGLAELKQDKVEKIKALIEKDGFKVSCIASPFLKCNIENQEEYNRHLTILNRSIKLAKYFDVPLVRCFTFWRKEEPMERYWDSIVEKLTKPVEIAESEGVTLALENEYACFIRTGEETRRIMREINSKNFRVIWDPGNAFFAGEIPYPDGYEKVRDFIAHFHLKDASRNEATGQYEWTVVGDGQIDFVGQFKALREDKYRGVISLETHYKIAGGTCEQATRRCVEGLYRILEKITE